MRDCSIKFLNSLVTDNTTKKELEIIKFIKKNLISVECNLCSFATYNTQSISKFNIVCKLYFFLSFLGNKAL